MNTDFISTSHGVPLLENSFALNMLIQDPDEVAKIIVDFVEDPHGYHLQVYSFSRLIKLLSRQFRFITRK